MALITLFMQFYIPLMIVTFDLKLIQIYKNALIFAFAGAFKKFAAAYNFCGHVCTLLFTSGYFLCFNYCIGFALDFLSFRVLFPS